MAWTTKPMFGRSACAGAYICLMLLAAPTGVPGRLVAHVHQAFWCSVIHAAVLCPIGAITYLSQRRLAPRVLQRLAPFLSLLWSEVICSSAARWVHLFVVHASLSPSLAGTSVALDGRREGPFAVVTHGLLYLCIIQIAHDITGVFRTFQATVLSESDNVMADADPLFGDRNEFAYAMLKRLVYVYLAGQGVVYGCLAYLFTAMALYLERMAAGTIVTAASNAHNTLSVPWDYVFATWATVILIATILNVWAAYEDARRPAEEELHLQFRELREGRQPPPPAAGRWLLTTINTAIPWEMLVRLGLRLVWALEECLRRLVLWRRHAGGLGWWSCPEVAALWSEDERRRFYAAALTGVPSSALAALWDHLPLRRRHVELWRRAGLTTDFILGGETTAGTPGARVPPDMTLFLGKTAVVLVRGLEATFGVCVVVGGILIVLTRYPFIRRQEHVQWVRL
ncbi:hypothetical protein INS49_003497 [Diaporthe citri]|uniref:uncharacterized protein n=1 Tax=Diaporthe citri TaxID=83186 RepID=UPI001C7EE256|nr:uncharacterized protein INS49_003497 [Diaporthe citri]KAG6355535.1 hypothetical protein INS49_003497 [Diaporthe citri]